MAVLKRRLWILFNKARRRAEANGEIRPGEPYTIRLIHGWACISNRDNGDKGDCDCNPTVEIVKSSVAGRASGIGGKK